MVVPTVGIKSTETGNLRIVSKTTPLPETPFALTYLIVHSQAARAKPLGKDDYLKIAKLSNLQTLYLNLNGKQLPDEFSGTTFGQQVRLSSDHSPGRTRPTRPSPRSSSHSD